MSDENVVVNVDTSEISGELNAMKTQFEDLKTRMGGIESLGEGIEKVLDFVESESALRDQGYVTDAGGADEPQTKSFGDFLLAIKREDNQRIKSVYKANVMAEGDGVYGGFTVPDEFLPALQDAGNFMAVVRPNASVIPVKSDQGRIPALDVVTAPTAGGGATALAGGVVASWGAEAATLTQTNAKFKEVQYYIRKLNGYVEVSNELIADSAASIEALLYTLFGRAVASMEDAEFLNGTGDGTPLGILKSPAAVAVTPDSDNQFQLADAVEMISKHQPLAGPGHWIMHRSVIPDLAAYFKVGTAGVDFIQPREGIPGSLLGSPLHYSEHLPLANASGCVILADLKSYLILDRAPLAIAYSEHAAFTSDKGTWRFIKRVDGRPWLSSTISEANPGTAHTVSPFVYFND